MGDIANMSRGFFLFLFSLKTCSGVIYTLNETEYAKMPPLYELDKYDSCLLKPGGLYCITDFDLFSEEKSDLMEMIHEYSALTHTHYNHTQIHRGICVTRTCQDFLKEHNIKGTLDLNATLEQCINKTIWKDYRLQARLNKVNYCHKYNKTSSMDRSDLFVLSLYFIIFALNASGTLYDMLFCEDGKGNRYLMAFSLRRNWNKLTASADDGPDPRIRRLKVFHGMKTLTMVCVLFSHVALVISYSYVENPIYFEMAGDDSSRQILYYGTLVTYTFFVIAGFLVAYNFQIYSEKHEITWWHLAKRVLLRWLRLTPVLALMIATVATLMRNAGKGPLWDWVVNTEAHACREYWWANLLYINNYMLENKCFLQTWYLACDLQLFVLGMAICIVARTPRAQKIAVSVTMILAMAILGAHTYFQNLDALLIPSPEKFRYLYHNDDMYNVVFRRGHTNMATYVMGIGAGFLTYNIQLQGIDVSKYKRYGWIVTWLSVPACVAVILSGSIFTNKVYPVAVKVIYATTYRQIFHCIMLIIVLTSIFKIENVQRYILEWRGFTWMSRASYNAFLVHSLLQRAAYGSERAPTYVTDYTVMVGLGSILFYSFTLGAILWLCVESPVNQLIKILLEPSPSTPTKDTPTKDTPTKDTPTKDTPTKDTKDTKEAQELPPSTKNTPPSKNNGE